MRGGLTAGARAHTHNRKNTLYQLIQLDCRKKVKDTKINKTHNALINNNYSRFIIYIFFSRVLNTLQDAVYFGIYITNILAQ